MTNVDRIRREIDIECSMQEKTYFYGVTKFLSNEGKAHSIFHYKNQSITNKILKMGYIIYLMVLAANVGNNQQELQKLSVKL